jgi:predicted RNA binding protein YcfA (HicA-like mRNA interferase family)
MPNKPPRITGEEAVKAFCKAEYFVDRIKGAHHILKHPQKKERLSIPVHKGTNIGIGLLSKQIKIAGMSNEEFYNLL